MKKKNIEFINMLFLRGPGIWAYRPVIEAWVDIGELEDYPSNTIPGFYERLVEWLPTLIEHRCSVGERGGFLQRVRQGTWAGHILEHVTLELQSLAGMPGGLGRARETPVRGVYKVIVRAWHEPLTRAALYSARDLVMAAIEDRPFDAPAAIAELRALADSLRLGPSTACIVDAADDRDIPMTRLSEANLVQLGYGARQRRIWTAETDRTSAIAEGISRDKDLTKSLLQACGVPVPEGQLVESPQEAWEAAESIGLPVVVKPCDGNHGRGVFTNLATQSEIETAYGIAVDEGSGVVVERFIRGDEHRLLVVGDRMVAAARGDAAVVVGDGSSTIEQLIESQLNSDPRRGRDEDHPLNFIRLDSAARLELARQNLAHDSIPAVGVQVLIQRNGNVSIDVTDAVHPSVAAAVALAARVVGLDIAGVDLVAEDISRPLEAQRGAIVEVNAGPGLLMHLKPAAGQPRPVGRAIVDHLFPEGDSGRIPIVGVSGSKGKTTVARLVARLLQLSGQYTGLACSSGLFFAKRHVEKTDCANWAAGHRVLINRAVQAAVIENSNRTILSEGLAYDRCQVGIVTNLDPADILPEFYVHEPEQIATVLRTQVDVVLPGGTAVLNADDPLLANMASLCDGAVVFFGMDDTGSTMAEHLAGGGRAVFVRDAWVVLADGRTETRLTEISSIPLTEGGQIVFQIRNVLAAVAAAWALDIAPDLIRAGVETFGAEPTDSALENASPVLEISG
ncbi:cyanophycin synthetase [Paralcaligenes sp. KSB-10]|jgi:cyanophycin synthetase|uniref:cyanophycin synthetase n=1 Tax=Paralcaligenes sp. KSB-10 TaxID=2901142 RepID=UPI001E5392C4|nr:cyanophycin synthetase [Paralcaligenes sp. KSB-10]UHL63702.1 cyanophycin synthetase [Paralcaligenes sp. KSB-10]